MNCIDLESDVAIQTHLGEDVKAMGKNAHIERTEILKLEDKALLAKR